MRALSDFLLRETLALVLDDASPRTIAAAMAADGGPLHAEHAADDDDTPLSEDSESQAARERVLRAAPQSRVVMVRLTNHQAQTVRVVDRRSTMDAVVTAAALEALQRQRGFKTIARLRGAMIRVDRYHFSTPSMCAADGASLIFPPLAHRSGADSEASTPVRLCLCFESIDVIDETESSVDLMPHVEENADVRKVLDELPPAELDARLMQRQGRTTVERVSTKRFDDEHPLLEDECVIPEDQERELDEQDGWGEDVEETTPVPAQADGQQVNDDPVSASPAAALRQHEDEHAQVTGDTMVVSASEEATPAEDGRNGKVVVPESQRSQATSDESIDDSHPDQHFPQQSIHDAFIECSDTESAGDGSVSESSGSDDQASTVSKELEVPTGQDKDTAAGSAGEDAVIEPVDDGAEEEAPLTQLHDSEATDTVDPWEPHPAPKPKSVLQTIMDSVKPPILSLSTWKWKPGDPVECTERPSKRFRHLLPAFNIDTIKRLITEKE
ncbi:hypothetical protein P43SY_008307 [Pythium insidiosum]|uniref:Uncharacterized protein n=1 Tax=Pythium insidiosum TaxID=114742 RepID=A0AAD5LS47_PYTIN|nr:hypothetical protein P43SY_008307 [Pythium insidiosum]